MTLPGSEDIGTWTLKFGIPHSAFANRNLHIYLLWLSKIININMLMSRACLDHLLEWLMIVTSSTADGDHRNQKCHLVYNSRPSSWLCQCETLVCMDRWSPGGGECSYTTQTEGMLLLQHIYCPLPPLPRPLPMLCLYIVVGVAEVTTDTQVSKAKWR